MPQKWGILDTPEELERKAIEAVAERRKLRKVIVAASVGALFVCYDFILFAALAPLIASHFFAGVNETTGFIFALLTFAAGFAVRPLGALFFGSMGDRTGRKKAFLTTLGIMGISTLSIGLLPGYTTIGIASPILLIFFRVMQGFAYGGEYGGAAIYAAEHAPKGKRGLYAGFIQSATGLALFLSFLVIFITRSAVGEDNFQNWGWRIPFLISVFLLIFTLGIRLRLEESPLFRKMLAQGKASKTPLREAFGESINLRLVLCVSFGLMSLQGVLFYTSHFYSQFFLIRILKVPSATINTIMMLITGVSVLFYLFFCWLSDYTGRKKIIMTGAVLSLATMMPFFYLLGEAANPVLLRAHTNSPVVVIADPADCSIQFDPVGQAEFFTSCDLARSTLANTGIGYSNEGGRPGVAAIIRIGDGAFISSINAAVIPADERATVLADFEVTVRSALINAGYPEMAAPEAINTQMITIVIFLMVVFAIMVYAPATVMALESFPTRIRYSALSLPYHIGSGWFGGFLPAIAFAMVVASGDLYSGLWYPMTITALAIIILATKLEETRDWDLDEVD